MSPVEDKSGFQFSSAGQGSKANEFGALLSQILRTRIYRFHAERLIPGSSPTGENETLAPNASNLAAVLNIMQANPSLFQRFNKLVNQIFPSVYGVSVRPPQGQQNQLEILVWSHDPETTRIDLAIKLAESGTGIGQVLAILYVAMNTDYSRTIIIDEPNSFLHPAAARKLIEILNTEFPHHQYIVTTHSSEIVSAASPDKLMLIRWDQPQSVVDQLDIDKIYDLEKVFREVGVKLSDVFGADHILWVEGETEEDCFRLLLKGESELWGTNIVAVRNTGDFQGKRGAPETIVAIYKILCRAGAIIPPAVAFVFDRETKTETQMTLIREKTGHTLHFLPRKMFENYLLSPAALSGLMNSLPSFRNSYITDEEVKGWMEQHGGDVKYYATPCDTIDLTNEHWITNVDAAKLLNDMFQKFSEDRYQLDKRQHCFWLTKWLLKHESLDLQKLKSWLLAVLRQTTK